MGLRWMMVVLMGGWLSGCGQSGPLYLPEEELVTEEVEVTETVASDETGEETGEETGDGTGAMEGEATVEAEVSESTVEVEVERVADPQRRRPEDQFDPPTGPGE